MSGTLRGRRNGSLGYDFRFDYDFTDYSEDFSYAHQSTDIGNGNVNASNRRERGRKSSLQRRDKYVPLSIAIVIKRLFSKDNNNNNNDDAVIHFIYTWSGRNSILAQILLKLGIIRERCLDTIEVPGNLLRLKSKKSSTVTKPRRRKSKIPMKKTPSAEDIFQKEKSENRMKRERIAQHISRLDKSSIQYKVLSQDKKLLRRIHKSELSKHILPSQTPVKKLTLEENPDGIWMLIHGLVFDISNVLDNHPGGVECLLDCTGVDATRVFDDVCHSDIAWEMLQNSCVGVMEEILSSDDEDEKEYAKKQSQSSTEPDESPPHTESETHLTEAENEDTRKDNYQLIWSDIALEYLVFVFFSLFGLLCFVSIQRRKWNEMEDGQW